MPLQPRRPGRRSAAVRFVHESVIPASVAEVFAFHERPDAFALLQPPWEHVDIDRPPSGLEVGTRVELRARIGPFRIPIVAEHVAYEKDALFVDEMRRGPFARWRHAHRFLAHPDGCLLRDEIDYLPRPAFLAWLADPIAVRPRLRRMFRHRHDVTRREVLAARAGR